MSVPEADSSNVVPIFGFREGQVAFKPEENKVTPYTEEETDAWVAAVGLPPRLPDELWHDWAARTAKERGVGSTVLKSVATDERTEQ